MRGLKLFWENKSGSTAVEYGLIISIIALTMVAALGNYYGAMNNMFGRISTVLDKSAE